MGAGDGFLSVELSDPSADELGGWADRFDLHPLAVDTALEHRRRARLHRFGDTVVTVLPTLEWDEAASDRMAETGRATLLFTERVVITVGHDSTPALDRARDELASDPDRLADGTWSVFYGVLDAAVDDWLDTSRRLGDRLDQIEAETFSGSAPDPSQTAYRLKRDLIEFKRQVVGLGVALHRLATLDHGPGASSVQAQLRELAAHHQLLADGLLSLDEVLGSIVQAAFARISVQQNEDMRRISAWVAIVAVPTFLAGVWGMNFQVMPELALPWGYFAALAVMLAIMIALYVTFKRHHWL